MSEQLVWIDSEAICCKHSSIPLEIEKIMDIRVVEYNNLTKMKRALLIAAVFGFSFFMIYPLSALVAVPLFFLLSYLLTKKYELRVTLCDNSEIGAVESGLCKSNDRDELVRVVNQVNFLKRV